LGTYLMGRAIDAYIGTHDLVGLARTVWIMLGCYILASGFTWGQNYIAASMGQHIVRDMRRDLFDKLQVLPLKYLDTQSHGDVMSRLTNDVENVNNVISGSATMLVSSLLGLVGTLGVMVYANIPMTLVTFVPRSIASNKSSSASSTASSRRPSRGKRSSRPLCASKLFSSRLTRPTRVCAAPPPALAFCRALWAR